MHAPDRPPTVLPHAVLRQADLARWLHPRDRDSHKGDNGHVLCVGGDHGSGGAIVLCAQAALRSGAGLASAATRAEHVPALLARQPEAMAHAVESGEAFAPLLQRADVVAIGPGLGRGEWGRALLAAALRAGKPLLLDADALNLLAADPDLAHACARRNTLDIMTPHPGEAARLLSCSIEEVQADRIVSAVRIARQYRALTALKGCGTVIATPEGQWFINHSGNPGLASAGMGDALSGMIAALVAQRLAPQDALLLAVHLHGAAADALVQQGLGPVGLTASEVMLEARHLLNLWVSA